MSESVIEKAMHDSPAVAAMLQDWGWATPPDEITKQAERCVALKNEPIEATVLELGFMDEKTITAALEQREEAGARQLSMIEYLATASTRVRDAKQIILCCHHAIQYFNSLESDHLQIHEAMQDPEIHEACERHEAVMMTLQEDRAILVFPDWDVALRRYRQIAGIEASNDALKNQYPDIIVAIAPKAQVSALLHGSIARKKDGAGLEKTQNQSMGIMYGDRLRDDPTLKKLANMHDLALELQASDIHIDPDSEGRVHLTYRVMGDMQRIPESMALEDYHELKNFLLRKSGASIKFEPLKEPKDGMYQYLGRGSQAYVRCSFIPLGHSSAGSEALVSICLRLIPVEHGKVDLAEKGVRPEVIEHIKYAVMPDAGIVLLVGPTGSGKSTTVSGTIGLHEDLYGSKKTRFSIEDPVERFLPGITQFQIPYHLRGKGSGFSLILRNILRHDPQLISIGEIRDAETAEISVNAASTGHLVVSTIHADSATKAVERLSNMVPPERQDLRNALIENLSLLVAQRLIKRLCRECRIEIPPTEEDVDYVNYLNRTKNMSLELPSKVYTHNPRGCQHCRQGIVGRIPVNEVLVITSDVKAIYLGDDPKERFSKIENAVAISMEQAIMHYIESGDTPADALKY